MSIDWETVGQTARLLSLEESIGSFTGGAHPNRGYAALLWDRRANREIAVTALFLKATSFAALTRKAYCGALDKERLKKREGEKLDRMFSDCPKYSELAIAPVDRNKNGRFETLRFVAGPYVAGPYVEGEYEMTLPVTSQLIAAIRARISPVLRASAAIVRGGRRLPRRAAAPRAVGQHIGLPYPDAGQQLAAGGDPDVLRAGALARGEARVERAALDVDRATWLRTGADTTPETPR